MCFSMEKIEDYLYDDEDRTAITSFIWLSLISEPDTLDLLGGDVSFINKQTNICYLESGEHDYIDGDYFKDYIIC